MHVEVRGGCRVSHTPFFSLEIGFLPEPKAFSTKPSASKELQETPVFPTSAGVTGRHTARPSWWYLHAEDSNSGPIWQRRPLTPWATSQPLETIYLRNHTSVRYVTSEQFSPAHNSFFSFPHQSCTQIFFLILVSPTCQSLPVWATLLVSHLVTHFLVLPPKMFSCISSDVLCFYFACKSPWFLSG